MADDGIAFRPLREVDLPLVTEWFGRPHVLEYWGDGDGPPTLDDITQEYVPRMEVSSRVKAYIAYCEGEPIGFVQSYVAKGCGDGWWEGETDPGVVGIDQFLCDGDRLGQGLGTRMVAAFVQRILSEPWVTKVQTDPDPGNARAIRCYEKAGFVRVAIVDTPDGPALLMVVEKTP